MQIFLKVRNFQQMIKGMIGASMSEPRTSELNGNFCVCVCTVSYVLVLLVLIIFLSESV